MAKKRSHQNLEFPMNLNGLVAVLKEIVVLYKAISLMFGNIPGPLKGLKAGVENFVARHSKNLKQQTEDRQQTIHSIGKCMKFRNALRNFLDERVERVIGRFRVRMADLHSADPVLANENTDRFLKLHGELVQLFSAEKKDYPKIAATYDELQVFMLKLEEKADEPLRAVRIQAKREKEIEVSEQLDELIAELQAA